MWWRPFNFLCVTWSLCAIGGLGHWDPSILGAERCASAWLGPGREFGEGLERPRLDQDFGYEKVFGSSEDGIPLLSAQLLTCVHCSGGDPGLEKESGGAVGVLRTHEETREMRRKAVCGKQRDYMPLGPRWRSASKPSGQWSPVTRSQDEAAPPRSCRKLIR